ncbi:amino acid transporter AVT1I-like [Dioscorea cayenensis subsp. rotundata]|uniref:Amino acid transporter AVT1I-like n=1 Tax=Dioscorea cayennensis subsp. rotundata TaxID=55577 RepID=A0AB40D5B5_DIOCR|nr:amino acid transporter AVT1I-like [Dioscorea cayenensis subsp. rotundata]
MGMTSSPSESQSVEHHAILVDYNDGASGSGGLGDPLLRHGLKDQEQDEDGAGFLRTSFNGLNALSGVGILSIPYALAEGGWLSLILLLMIAIICCYTGLLLQRCTDANPSVRTYPDIGGLAFGYKGRVVVSVFMYVEIFLVAIGFLILEGDNLDNLFPGMSLEIGDFRIAGKQFFVVLIALVILPTTWLKNLGVLAYVSAGGVLASIIIVFSVLWAATFDGVGFHQRGRPLNVAGLPTSLGLYAFCYCGHAVFPTISNSMRNKAQYPKVLVLCFVLCTINYASMAVLGYLMYGNEVKSQVTLNLPLGHLSSKIAIYTTLINPFTKYALVITPIANAIEERLRVYNKRSSSVLVRTLLVSSTVIIAIMVPFFADLMSFIGSLLSVIVSMLLPCICYLMIFKDSRKSKIELVFIVLILVFGVLVASLGSYTSVKKIIQEM